MNDFKVEFEVRDNEVDIQGVVNNANYFIYLAHARHKFAQKYGVDFTEYAKNKQNLFLLSTETVFKNPLRSNDKFYVTCKLINIDSKIKFAFTQEIHLVKNDTIIAKSINTIACINENISDRRKKFYIPEEIKNLLF